MDDLIEVSRDDFYAYVNPRDIIFGRCERDYLEWKTRSGVLIGRTTPGYTWKGVRPADVYYLTRAALAALRGE